MTQEEKDLLLKELCARLPYGVKVKTPYNDATLVGIVSRKGVRKDLDYIDIVTDKHTYPIRYIQPYLRPMSSMTEEECMELSKIRPFDDDVEAWKYVKTPVPLTIANIKHFDFFHSHHLDWRGLIEKGLALVAPEGMYTT